MREPARASLRRMVKPISSPARVSFAISTASCFRSDTFEGPRTGLGDIDILIFRTVAHADCADADAIHLQRDAAAQWQLPAAAGDGKAEREKDVHFIAAARR